MRGALFYARVKAFERGRPCFFAIRRLFYELSYAGIGQRRKRIRDFNFFPNASTESARFAF